MQSPYAIPAIIVMAIVVPIIALYAGTRIETWLHRLRADSDRDYDQEISGGLL